MVVNGFQKGPPIPMGANSDLGALFWGVPFLFGGFKRDM